MTVIGLTAASWNRPADWRNFLDTRAELLMREVGHRTLLYAGDSTSRVLPVAKLSEAVFQLRFERTFSFVPDSLISIVDKSFAASKLPLQYRVSVFDCGAKALVYGFEIMRQGSVVPCQGRVQPTGCYTIQVEFIKPAEGSEAVVVWSVALAGLVVIGFVAMRRKTTAVDGEPIAPHIRVGKFQFDASRARLFENQDLVELSDKEAQILGILIGHLNQLVEREHLMKRVWEDEGVFVGRSLDVFISRLRKKLQSDPLLRIVNVHGKGYKLEVATSA